MVKFVQVIQISLPQIPRMFHLTKTCNRLLVTTDCPGWGGSTQTFDDDGGHKHFHCHDEYRDYSVERYPLWPVWLCLAIIRLQNREKRRQASKNTKA